MGLRVYRMRIPNFILNQRTHEGLEQIRGLSHETRINSAKYALTGSVRCICDHETRECVESSKDDARGHGISL